jgi:hypothetical protein
MILYNYNEYNKIMMTYTFNKITSEIKFVGNLNNLKTFYPYNPKDKIITEYFNNLDIKIVSKTKWKIFLKRHTKKLKKKYKKIRNTIFEPRLLKYVIL